MRIIRVCAVNVYLSGTVCALVPTPNEVLKQLNQLLFKFLWKGTDKVRRASVINEYREGGLKMIDLETMVKSLRLAIVFTRAAPAFEDLFNTCIWLLLDTNTVHTTAKKETFEYLLKLTSM